MDLKGKIALLTGGSRGIGQAIAKLLAQRGASIFMVDVGDEASSEETVGAIQAIGGSIAVYYGDIADPNTNAAAFAACIETFGTPDFFIANAGLSKITPIAEATIADFHAIFNTNVLGTFLGIQEAQRRMKPGGKVIVITSSTVQYPVEGLGLYTGSKAALHAIVKAAAMELAPMGITVNAVLPGVTASQKAMRDLDPAFVEMVEASTPLGRIGQPEDVAKTVLLLCSDDAAWLTGQFITANGGGKF